MRGRVGCFTIVITIALLWGGGQNIYTAATNRAPTTMSVSEYGKIRPRVLWLELTSCRPALAEALYREKYGKIEELYLPLRGPGETGTIHVLLATKNAELILAYQQLQTCKTPEEAITIFQAHAAALKSRESVKGLVRYGIDLKNKDSKKMASLEKLLAPDFVILDENKEPNLGMGLLLFIPGLLIGGFGAYKAVRP